MKNSNHPFLYPGCIHAPGFLNSKLLVPVTLLPGASYPRNTCEMAKVGEWLGGPRKTGRRVLILDCLRPYKEGGLMDFDQVWSRELEIIFLGCIEPQRDPLLHFFSVCSLFWA